GAHLPGIDRLDAGADDFGDVGAGRDRERDYAHREGVELDAGRRQPVVEEQQRDQERYPPHQRHVGRNRPREQAMAGEPPHAGNGSNRRADQDRDDGELGREQRAPRQGRERLQEQREFEVHSMPEAGPAWRRSRVAVLTRGDAHPRWCSPAVVHGQRRCHSSLRKSRVVLPSPSGCRRAATRPCSPMPARTGGDRCRMLWERVGSSRCFCGTHHFRLDRVVEHDPCLLHLWSERGTKLLSQAPYQRVTKRNKMRGLYAKLRVLAASVADDGLAYFTLIERANDRGEGIHQLELLLFHIVREQPSCFGRELEESTVELLGEFATEWPQRVERFPN